MTIAAHVRQLATGEFVIHSLEDHLLSVARLARRFAEVIDAGAWGELAGIWHDLGKYQATFQRHIASASGLDRHIEAPGRVKHAIAGAIHATEAVGSYGRCLAYLIAGHHAGLPDWLPGDAGGAALCQELQSEAHTLAKSIAGGVPAAILSPGITLTTPTIHRAEDLHFWLRMLFSCLVDADFLDTEKFMDDGRTELRGSYPKISVLGEAFQRHMASRFAVADTPVKGLRADILTTCIERAAQPPGLFSLTVPTGGGKTLASLGFALQLSLIHI